MTKERSRQLQQLRARYARSLVLGATLLVALQIRATVREVLSTAVHLAVVTWAAPPGPREVVAYLQTALHAPGRHFTHAVQNSTRRSDVSPGEGGWKARLPDAGQAQLLHDTRVQKLQRRIVSAVFHRRFGLSLDNSQAQTLGAYSSVAWLARNLANAAGYGNRPPKSAEARSRLSVVLPVFVRVLAMHRRYLVYAAQDSHPHAVTRGVITANYYPNQITVEALRNKIVASQKRTNLRRVTIQAKEEALRLDRRLEAVTLLHSRNNTGHAPRRPRSSRRAARALGTMQRIQI